MLFVNLCISLIIYFVRGSVSKYVCSDVNSNVTTNEIYKDARNLYYGKDLIYSLTHFNVFGHSFFSMLYCFEMKKKKLSCFDGYNNHIFRKELVFFENLLNKSY